MAVPAESYLSFIVPATLALWLGLHLPLKLRAEGKSADTRRVGLTRREKKGMDILIAFGFFVQAISSHLPPQLNFLYCMLGLLRFVGALALMFTSTRGWQWRVGVVYLGLLIHASSEGLFYEFVLWCGYLFISFAYLKRWRWKLLFFLAISFLVLTILNGVKQEYRQRIVAEEISNTEKVTTLGTLMWDSLGKGNDPYSIKEERGLGDKLVRWNQGWIIARIMSTVPDIQPYAKGETILSAIVASIVPRVCLPGKLGASSKETFERFTGLRISQSTSMALGVAGEMYANFGRIGGILSTFVYGLLIGFIFSKFNRLAEKDILWWAWAPFVLLPCIEAEWNLVDVLNHITKSSIVMIGLIYLIPVFRTRLLSRRIRN